jgi:hypothetical protein
MTQTHFLLLCNSLLGSSGPNQRRKAVYQAVVGEIELNRIINFKLTSCLLEKYGLQITAGKWLWLVGDQK